MFVAERGIKLHMLEIKYLVEIHFIMHPLFKCVKKPPESNGYYTVRIKNIASNFSQLKILKYFSNTIVISTQTCILR